jgi:hypothetical protein
MAGWWRRLFRGYAGEMSAAFRTFFATACSRSILAGAGRIALVVGSILNLINQGPRVYEGLGPSWPHVLLNFLVPFCVSTYSATRSLLRMKDASRPPN